MTINNEFNTLSNAISDIKTEISNKGQTVQPTDTVSSLSTKIDNISNINGENYARTVLNDIIEGKIEYLYDEVLLYIRPYCFMGCRELKKVYVKNLLKICRHAFDGCYNLNTLILETENFVRLDEVNAFKFTPMDGDGKGIIYVPDNLYDTYIADENWYYYREHIKPISMIDTNNKIFMLTFKAADDFNTDDTYYFES